MIAFFHEHGQFVWKELSSKADRVVGVVGGAFVEDWLTKAIKSRLVSSDTDTIKACSNSLFNDLLDFRTKIHLGFLMGLLSPDFYSDLDHIRQIRNAFSHWLAAPVSQHKSVKLRFSSSQKIKHHCEKLISPDGFSIPLPNGKTLRATSLRNRFVLAVIRISGVLVMNQSATLQYAKPAIVYKAKAMKKNSFIEGIMELPATEATKVSAHDTQQEKPPNDTR